MSWYEDLSLIMPLVGGIGGAAIGSAIPGAGTAVGGLVGTSMGTAIGNLFSQQENYHYQKGLQQDIFQREDNSVQRRTQDLLKAGLSPTLAAGSSAGSGAVVSTQAPQMNENAAQMLSLISMSKNLQQTEANTELAKQQILKAKADTALSWQNDAEKQWNLDYAKTKGIPTTLQGLTGQVLGAESAARKLYQKATNVFNEPTVRMSPKEMFNKDGTYTEAAKKAYNLK
jgi:predicted acylesterase/phospholipase RssA